MVCVCSSLSNRNLGRLKLVSFNHNVNVLFHAIVRKFNSTLIKQSSIIKLVKHQANVHQYRKTLTTHV